MTATPHDSPDDDVFDLRARAMLDDDGERVDVTGAVLDRLANGDAPAPTQEPHRGRWLAAAMLLLGLTVVGVVLLQGRGDAPGDNPAAGTVERLDPPPASEWPPRDSDWHEVRSPADIAALPPGVRWVRGTNLTDAMVAQLVARTELEGLVLRTLRTDSLIPVSLTPAALPQIGSVVTLRWLDLIGHPDISGHDLAPLAVLPVLEHLGLRSMDTRDRDLAFLATLASLRELDLTLNHGFREGGLQHVAGAMSLESLVLGSCSQLLAEDLRPLRSLRRLRRLDVTGIGNTHRGCIIFDPNVATLTDLPIAIGNAARAHEHEFAHPTLSDGMPDAFLQAIAEILSIEELILDRTKVLPHGLSALAPLRNLRRLSVEDCAQLDVKDALLPASLEHLSLGDTATNDATLVTLARRQHLRSLDLTGCPISAAGLDVLRDAEHIEVLAFGTFDWDADVLGLFDAGIRVHWTGDPEHELASLTEAWAGNRPLRRDLRLARENGTAPPIKLRRNATFSADGGVSGHVVRLIDGRNVDETFVISVSGTGSLLVRGAWDPNATPLTPNAPEEFRLIGLLNRWADATWTQAEQAEILALPSIPELPQLDQSEPKKKRLLRELRLYERVAYPEVDKVFEGGGTVTLSLALTPRGGREQIILWRALDDDAFAQLYVGNDAVPVDSGEEAALLLSLSNWLARQIGDDDPRPFAAPPADLAPDARKVWDACRGYLQQTSPRIRSAGTVMDDRPGGSRFFELSAADFSIIRYRFDHAARSATPGRLFVDETIVDVGSAQETAALERLERAAHLRRRALGEDLEDDPVDARASMILEEIEAYRAAFVRSR